MSVWTKQKLEQLIPDKVEESLTVEYKGADALAKTDGKRAEITKDVSAFANSSGGVLIYGIAEPQDKNKRHIAERLDPISRTEFSKEWLEQVIEGIQPRVEGIVIHPVTIDEQQNRVCYVVEIPQSHTAHQARDYRYHKRHNFNVLPMEDYEMRDVMNRKTHPKIRASIFVNKRTDAPIAGLILVKLENVGRILVRDIMVEIEIPVDLAGFVMVEKPVICENRGEGRCYVLRLTPGPGQAPIFPDSDVTLWRKIRTNVRAITDEASGNPVTSARQVKVSVFADEMPPLRALLDIMPVISGWTLVGQSRAASG